MPGLPALLSRKLQQVFVEPVHMGHEKTVRSALVDLKAPPGIIAAV
jgi:hypothetical protein